MAKTKSERKIEPPKDNKENDKLRKNATSKSLAPKEVNNILS
jgi:hypothetical protein